MADDNGSTYVTNRELINEIRTDVKGLLAWTARADVVVDTVPELTARVKDLEASHLFIKGAWGTTTVIAGAAAGVAGLLIGVIGITGI